MFKRKRDEELPRSKRLLAASADLLRREWVQKLVLSKDGVTRRADGTFAFKLRKMSILTRPQIDEIVKAVVTDTEMVYVHIYVEDRHLVVSVEIEYPAKSAMRREERKKDSDLWWRNVDLHDKNADDLTTDSVWSNELAAIPEFDRNCMITAHPMITDKHKYVIHLIKPIHKLAVV